MKTAIFFGSETGATEGVANKVGQLLGADVFPAGDISKASGYDFVILASSTWGMGDLASEWEASIDTLKETNLSGKKVGFIGLGDQEGFGDTFVDAIGILYDAVRDMGITVVGKTSTEGYSYGDSKAVVDGEFIGLVIDENNQSELTDERIQKWVEKVK